MPLKKKKSKTKQTTMPKKKKSNTNTPVTHEQKADDVSQEECLLKELAYMTSEFFLIYEEFQKKTRR